METTPPDIATLESLLALCAQKAQDFAATADRVGAKGDPYGAAAANIDALAFLKMSASIGTALGKIRSHKVSEMRVYRLAEPQRPAAAKPARNLAAVAPEPVTPSLDWKDPKSWTADDEEEFNRDSDEQWDEMMRGVAKARKARLEAGTHVRLHNGQIVEIPEGETAESVLKAARQGEYGHEAAHAAFDAEAEAEEAEAENAKTGQGEGGPHSISDGTNAGK